MVKKKIVIVLVAVVAGMAGYMAAVRFFTTEEARIRGKFREAASIVSKAGEEENIAMIGVTRLLENLLADPCSIEITRTSLSGSYSPRELASLVARGRGTFEELELSFHDLDITLRGESRADVIFTAHLTGKRAREERIREIREMEATLVKNEDQDWVFSKINVKEVLRK